jgi:hypothetical protein
MTILHMTALVATLSTADMLNESITTTTTLSNTFLNDYNNSSPSNASTSIADSQEGAVSVIVTLAGFLPRSLSCSVSLVTVDGSWLSFG